MIYILQSDLRIVGVFTGEGGFSNLLAMFDEFVEISMKHSTFYRTRFGPHDPLFFDANGDDIGDLKASKYTDSGDWEAFTPLELAGFRDVLYRQAKRHDTEVR